MSSWLKVSKSVDVNDASSSSDGSGDGGFSFDGTSLDPTVGPGLPQVETGALTTPIVGSATWGYSLSSFSLSSASLVPPPSNATVTIVTPDSGLKFVNTYESSCTAAYETCIVAAEHLLATFFTSSFTLNMDFKAQSALNVVWALENSASSDDQVSFAALKAKLPSSDVLPASDPDSAGGNDFTLPEAYARFLGLSTSTPAYDDIVTLNLEPNNNPNYWSYGQDIINGIAHEITENGMGRVGGLGDQNSAWSTMDLFRYKGTGAYDTTDGRDGDTTYFSSDGGKTLSNFSFNNEYTGNGTTYTKQNSNDTADWTQTAVFGSTGGGETLTLTQTEINVMAALGWRTAMPQDVFDYQGTVGWGDNPTYWSTGSAPITPEDAFIGGLGTSNVSIAYSVTVNSIGTDKSSGLTIRKGATFTATDGTTLSSAETYALANGNIGEIDVSVGASLDVGNTFTNEGSLYIGGLDFATSGYATWVLTGTVTLNGGGDVYLGQQLTKGASTGTISGGGLVNVNNLIEGSGTLALTSFDNQANGALQTTQGYSISLTATTMSNEGNIVASSDSYLYIGTDGAQRTLQNTGDIVLDADSNLYVEGTLDINGGSIVMATGADITSDLGASTSLSFGGTLTEEGSGQIGDSGLFGGDNDLSVFNSGTVAVTGAGHTLTINTGTLLVNDTGLLEAENGAQLVLASDVNLGSPLVPTPTNPFNRAGPLGTIEATSGGVVTIEGQVSDIYFPAIANIATGDRILIDGGTVDAEAGSFLDEMPVYFTSNGGTLDLDSTLASTDAYVYGGVGTVNLTSASAVLIGASYDIDFAGGSGNVADISGVDSASDTISGFGVGDTVTIDNVKYSASDFVSFVRNSADTGGTVTVDNASGTALASFAVTGDYTPSQFKLSDVSGDLALVGAAGLPRATAQDFNGDGVSDILWRDSATGADSLWDMTAAGGHTAVNPGTVATGYQVAGIGDFNGDGLSDILWRDAATGADTIWDMTASGGHSAVNPGTVATSYEVAGVGDFNGDGIADILWRNTTTGADTIWVMTASGGRTAVNIGTVATDWEVAGIGDFNGDGVADILWRNTTTGADTIWDMNVSGGHIAVNPGTVATSWQVAGIGDFNGDGVADILWRNTTTGADSLWYMTPSGGRTTANPGTVSTAYAVAGVGDFNGDGVADILWRNATTGADAIWDMNASGGHATINPGALATGWKAAF